MTRQPLSGGLPDFYDKAEMSPASIGWGVYRRQEGVSISLLPNALLKC